MEKINGGCILLARKIQESDIWKKPSDWLKIWLYILQDVNFSDRKGYSRGENLFNYKDIARECNVSYNSVAKFIKWAKSATLVATEKTTRGVHIKVLNYGQYQELENYKGETKGDSVGETEAKQKRNRSDTIREECKKNKNEKNTSTEKEFSDDIKQLSDFLYELIKENNPNFKGDPRKWDDAFDKVIRIDQRPYEEVAKLIQLVQEDSFWKSNILSGEKFRKQYDQLIMKMSNKTGNVAIIS